MNGKIIISSFTKLVLDFIYPKYKYLARDEDDLDGLQAYEEEPEKENNFDGAWDTYGGDSISLRFIQDKLPFIKWSDEKPWRIKEDILDVAVVINEDDKNQTKDKEKKQFILFYHPGEDLIASYTAGVLRIVYKEAEFTLESTQYVDSGKLILWEYEDYKLPDFTKLHTQIDEDYIEKRHIKEKMYSEVYRAFSLENTSFLNKRFNMKK